jgi:hypothetical protein
MDNQVAIPIALVLLLIGPVLLVYYTLVRWLRSIARSWLVYD